MLWRKSRQVNECPGVGSISKALLVKNPVAVEKGTKAVISVNSRVYGRRTFNNLQTNFAVEIP
jgi:hypothetical protein